MTRQEELLLRLFQLNLHFAFTPVRRLSRDFLYEVLRNI